MEAHRTSTRWTYAEFAGLPSEGAERREIIAGELFVTPTPSPRHQRVVMQVAARLHAFVRERRLGEVLLGPIHVLFAEGDDLEPDLVFMRAGREAMISDRGLEGPPDLVVEVASPPTGPRDRGLELDRYRHFGVREYWIVDPDARAVEVWDLAAGAAQPPRSGSGDGIRWTLLPDGETLGVRVDEVFAGV